MRPFLFAALLCCLFAVRPGHAQPASLPAAPGADAPRAALGEARLAPAGGWAAPADTAAAVHHLFARYRARRLRVALGTLLVGTGLTIASAASVKPANDPLAAGFAGFGAILAGTLTAVLVPIDLVALGHVSRRHERLVLAQWPAQPLPAQVRRALRPHDFTAPAP